MSNVVEIRSPIWSSRSIGIAEGKLGPVTRVKITYRDRKGQLVYPHEYIIPKEKALRYPVQLTRGTPLRIIPIADMEILENRSN